MPDYMKDLGSKMVDGGFNILPIAPSEKYPGEFGIRGWQHMSDWGRYVLRQPTPLELIHWERWPGAGIGVPCGRTVVGIDIDILNTADAYEARRITKELLGDTPAYRIGESPKSLSVYRVTQEITSVSFGQFDILGLGRQFVSYGIHPRTQMPYSWPDEGIADLALEDLPLVTAAQVEDLCTTLAIKFPCNRIHGQMLNPNTSIPKDVSALRASYSEVRSAIAHLPNPDLPYNEWMRIGMALKGALGDEGASLFQEWSLRSSKYEPDITAKAWRSFKPDRVGAGTVFYIAKANGWQREPIDYNNHPGRKFFKEYNSHA